MTDRFDVPKSEIVRRIIQFIAELETRAVKEESALRAQHKAGQEAMREWAANEARAHGYPNLSESVIRALSIEDTTP